MSLDTIEKKIENLKKLKAVLKDKISRVDLQLQQEKIKKENQKLYQQKKKKKLNHLKSKQEFNNN